ncbi:Unknown protein [Striga hermonthica]|uniref:Reverse transcriptase zinc-binding domain-containing protein n=1 Tax=Striga hermonthica TaxID=68872 RepID=A0A9N7RME4_STRHE|nr:Unknown protein [Striga hermonthica]
MVGNGQSIDIWDSPWIPKATRFVTQCCFPADRVNLSKVVDLMLAGRSEWDSDLIFQSFTPQDAENILKIHISKLGRLDKLIWLPNKKGTFTVKSAYQVIQRQKNLERGSEGSSMGQGIQEKVWRVTWHMPIKPNIKTFIWRCYNKCLSTADNLRHRGIKVDEVCCWCGEKEKIWNT